MIIASYILQHIGTLHKLPVARTIRVRNITVDETTHRHRPIEILKSVFFKQFLNKLSYNSLIAFWLFFETVYFYILHTF
jgi:hypothetical protein